MYIYTYIHIHNFHSSYVVYYLWVHNTPQACSAWPHPISRMTLWTVDQIRSYLPIRPRLDLLHTLETRPSDGTWTVAVVPLRPDLWIGPGLHLLLGSKLWDAGPPTNRQNRPHSGDLHLQCRAAPLRSIRSMYFTSMHHVFVFSPLYIYSVIFFSSY